MNSHNLRTLFLLFLSSFHNDFILIGYFKQRVQFVCLLFIYLFKQVEVLAAIQLMWTCYTHPPIYTQRTATTPGTSSPILFSNSVWVPQGTNEHGSYLGNGTSGLSSLSEKTWKSNHLRMLLQRQRFLLSYLKTLSVGPAGVELTTYRMIARCSTNGARCSAEQCRCAVQCRTTRGVLTIERYGQRLTHRACMGEAGSYWWAPGLI